MAVLSSELRNRLENTVKAARRQAETAARAALERLTVGNAEPGGHMTVEERQLRNRLRAHGRQLGDQRDAKTGTQSTTRIIHECAYEHWHRMLFARFLAENNLLIHDKEGMPVTLAECDELAADEGAPDGWTLAARYAARMLPQIFRPDDPVLQVGFAPEHKRGLEKLLMELRGEVFMAEDSLGWVYQFWQADRKDEVNASGDKITGETLPPVTQLFTEHYMVLFLLHNTIGAWWAARLKTQGRVPKSEWDKCRTEADCRKLVALPGYDFTYLRFVRNADGEWMPAAGGFPAWPNTLKDFTLLDPSCGSGHFLVAAFLLLVLVRMHDEKLSATDSCDAVLRENLHGLELDQRCTQIAAFALALTAWKFTGGFRPLPQSSIACSGIGVNARKEDWLALANGDTRLRSGLERLYDVFQKAPELGSLINPSRLVDHDLLTAGFSEIEPLLTKALQAEKTMKDNELSEICVAAQGMAHAARILVSRFSLVATNVPFLTQIKFSESINSFIEDNFFAGKANLATAFVLRMLSFAQDTGCCAFVSPQSWWFLKRYYQARIKLLQNHRFLLLVLLGENAFQSTQAGGELVGLTILSKGRPCPEDRVKLLDISSAETPETKATVLTQHDFCSILQREQLSNQDSTILFSSKQGAAQIRDLATALRGVGNGDSPRFVRFLWEVPQIGGDWELHQTTTAQTRPFGGMHEVIFWQKERGELAAFAESVKMLNHAAQNWRRGKPNWGKKGVVVSQMGDLHASLYQGDIYDPNCCAIVPEDPSHVPALWAFCSSGAFPQAVKQINPNRKFEVGTFLSVPFDVAHWKGVAAKNFPNGLPQPTSNDPTQWLFDGGLPSSTTPLHVGVARLLGYLWPRQMGLTVSCAPPVSNDGLERFVDEDGIVCIPSVRGEAPAPERLRALLASAYGNNWSPAVLDQLLSAADYDGSNLEDWLRNGCFVQHCKLFQQRPFIWQIWDGRKDGFSALVNYHKLDHRLLEKLSYTYLGDWIKKQQDALADEQSGADDRLLKAQQLQEKLKLILEGEAPYDIFVRWKTLEQQPIGWHPDLNDGVRLNIRPFMEADVLRKRPNIKLGVDRGKNPPGSPWGEERDNDRHLSLAEKQKARTK